MFFRKLPSLISKIFPPVLVSFNGVLDENNLYWIKQQAPKGATDFLVEYSETTNISLVWYFSVNAEIVFSYDAYKNRWEPVDCFCPNNQLQPLT